MLKLVRLILDYLLLHIPESSNPSHKLKQRSHRTHSNCRRWWRIANQPISA